MLEKIAKVGNKRTREGTDKAEEVPEVDFTSKFYSEEDRNALKEGGKISGIDDDQILTFVDHNKTVRTMLESGVTEKNPTSCWWVEKHFGMVVYVVRYVKILYLNALLLSHLSFFLCF